MNADNVYFFAQSLDNKSSDIIAVGRNLLSTEDNMAREQAMEKMTSISKKGKVVYKSDSKDVSILLDHDDEAFLLEIVPLEKDSIGRKAPIISFGKVPDNASDNWVEFLIDALNNFTDEVGRKSDIGTEGRVREGLFELLKKKKRSLNKNARVLITGMTVVYLWFLILSVSHVNDLVSFLFPPLGVLSYVGIVFRKRIASYLKGILGN